MVVVPKLSHTPKRNIKFLNAFSWTNRQAYPKIIMELQATLKSQNNSDKAQIWKTHNHPTNIHTLKFSTKLWLSKQYGTVIRTNTDKQNKIESRIKTINVFQLIFNKSIKDNSVGK